MQNHGVKRGTSSTGKTAPGQQRPDALHSLQRLSVAPSPTPFATTNTKLHTCPDKPARGKTPAPPPVHSLKKSCKHLHFTPPAHAGATAMPVPVVAPPTSKAISAERMSNQEGDALAAVEAGQRLAIEGRSKCNYCGAHRRVVTCGPPSCNLHVSEPRPGSTSLPIQRSDNHGCSATSHCLPVVYAQMPSHRLRLCHAPSRVAPPSCPLACCACTLPSCLLRLRPALSPAAPAPCPPTCRSCAG